MKIIFYKILTDRTMKKSLPWGEGALGVWGVGVVWRLLLLQICLALPTKKMIFVISKKLN